MEKERYCALISNVAFQFFKTERREIIFSQVFFLIQDYCDSTSFLSRFGVTSWRPISSVFKYFIDAIASVHRVQNIRENLNKSVSTNFDGHTSVSTGTMNSISVISKAWKMLQSTLKQRFQSPRKVPFLCTSTGYLKQFFYHGLLI